VIRTLLYLIVTAVGISLLRGVIGWLARWITGAAVGLEGRASARARASSTEPEALRKDPVCGTFVAPSAAVRGEKNGQVYYFCSPACRDRF
jgi:hypothetical protein